jgi:hypothetical protein
MAATTLARPHRQPIDVSGQPPGPPPPDTADPSDGGGDRLIRLTVLLLPSAYQALASTAQTTGYTKPDVVNRALQVYQVIEDVLREDGGRLRLWHRDGRVETIFIL